MEIKPNKINRYNQPAFGLLLGMILPIISFFIYYLILFINNNGISFKYFTETLKVSGTIIPIMSLCVLPNLIIFFIFKKKDYWYAIKGVVTSVFIYTLVVVVLKFI